MRYVVAFALVVAAAAPASAKKKPPPAPSMVGRWTVIGCETSPKDPDNCAHGTITFDASHFSVELPCCKLAHDYTVISTSAKIITITADGRTSEIHLDDKGQAQWNPGIGGRVGYLTFVREPAHT